MTKTVTTQSAAAVDDEVCIAFSTVVRAERTRLTASQVTEKRISFLYLPAEVRNKIYWYSLVLHPRSARIRSLVQPPLTHVNRQVRSEALPIYYGNNRFEIKIPPRPPMKERDDWADFIRMFRVFKAGRTAGPGTGSLQFLRNVSCIHSCARESFWDLEAVFVVPADPGSRNFLGCEAWDIHFAVETKDDFLMTKRDHVYKCVEQATGVEDVLIETCLHRLVSTVVMVATECPGIVEEVHFHANIRDEDEIGLDYW